MQQLMKLLTAISTPPEASSNPAAIDLDGDGLETVGTNAGILFDQTGSGVRMGTGWVSKDDGFLALDHNGNGMIDSGRELFGDSTFKNGVELATDGFDALRQLAGLSLKPQLK